MTTPVEPNPEFQLIAAPLTPMNPDGSVKLEMIGCQARKLVEDDIDGAFVCGTTGEGLSLTQEERMQVAERWIQTAPSLPIIVHVSHPSPAVCQDLVRHAQVIGAQAVACLGPIFFRPSTLEDLVTYCAETAAAASDLPFFFYHIPSMTGLNFSMAELLQLGSRRIPNLAGVKFTHENLVDFRQCLTAEAGRFEIFFGRDEMLLGALAMGGRGAVGSTYNYAAPLYHEMISAYVKGDMATARRCQSRSIELVAILARYGFLAASKAFMSFLGIDCGPVRSPLRPLSDAAVKKLRCELANGNFLPEEPTPGPG